jgi:hypothetical protein
MTMRQAYRPGELELTINWQSLAKAVACRIEWDMQCGYGDLLDESALVRIAADYLHAHWPGTINFNVPHPHPHLDRKLIDVTGSTVRSGRLKLALEAKWVRDGGTREWLVEIAVDLFRLQYITQATRDSKDKVDQNCTRVVLVAGTHKHMHDEVWTHSANTKQKSRVEALPLILPVTQATGSNDFTVLDLRRSARDAWAWLRKCHKKFGHPLPSTYGAQMAGRFITDQSSKPSNDAIEVVVWLTTRPQGWATFDPAKEWK